MTADVPATAVLRVSSGSFDPALYADISALSTKQAEYLIPAIKALPGLLDFVAGVSPDGSMVNFSVWDTAEHAAQMNQLKEMAVIARGEMEAAGVVFNPIVTQPVSWTI
ncbi:hypothetical protein ABH926_001254 [Catenulispora sp. GP43]|uniref:hypothetical protein n=1 Tax=Catenulispora sp. GP43 TaxID=3156263 RepID=UPI003511D5F6